MDVGVIFFMCTCIFMINELTRCRREEEDIAKSSFENDDDDVIGSFFIVSTRTEDDVALVTDFVLPEADCFETVFEGTPSVVLLSSLKDESNV